MKKIRTTKSVTVKNFYWINDIYKYVEIIEGGKLKSSYIDFNKIKFKKLYGYPCLIDSVSLKEIQRNDLFSKDIYKYLMQNPTPEQIEDTENYTIISFNTDWCLIFKNDKNNNMRLSPIIITINYINGRFLTNKYLKIDDFIKHLKSRNDIIDVEMEKIPYYNASDDETESITFKILPSEKEYHKMYNISKKINEEYWGSEFLNLISGNNYKIYDFLGIKKYLKKKDDSIW